MNDYHFKIVKKHFSKITRSALAVMTLFAADTLAGPMDTKKIGPISEITGHVGRLPGDCC